MVRVDERRRELKPRATSERGCRIAYSNALTTIALDRVLSLVWVTPNVHKIHHSREVSETNSNYANLLTIYDRLLGTYTPSERAESVVYGLTDAERMSQASFPALVVMPFQSTGNASAEVTERTSRLEGADL